MFMKCVRKVQVKFKQLYLVSGFNFFSGLKYRCHVLRQSCFTISSDFNEIGVFQIHMMQWIRRSKSDYPDFRDIQDSIFLLDYKLLDINIFWWRKSWNQFLNNLWIKCPNTRPWMRFQWVHCIIISRIHITDIIN